MMSIKKNNVGTHLNGSLGFTSSPLPPPHLPILLSTRIPALRAPTRRRRRPNKMLPIGRLQILHVILKAHTPPLDMLLRLWLVLLL